MFGLGAQEVIILVVLCALAALSLWAWAARRPESRGPAAPAEEPPDRARQTAGGWLSARRIGFIVLAWLFLGIAGMNARNEPPEDKPWVFLGGALWSVGFLVAAFWPRRARGGEPPDRGGEW